MPKIDNSKLDPGTWGGTKAAKVLVNICKEQNLPTKGITKWYNEITNTANILLYLAAQSKGVHARFAIFDLLKHYQRVKAEVEKSDKVPEICKSYLLNIIKVAYNRAIKVLKHFNIEYQKKKLIRDKEINEFVLKNGYAPPYWPLNL